MEDGNLVRAIREQAIVLGNGASDLRSIAERLGERRIVLLGEATHGTRDFYRERAQLTERLVRESGFTAVAIEGDWPDAARVNRYVRGADEDESAEASLRGFARFPTWMWRNPEVVRFVHWLRVENDKREEAARVGFYGLDLYSLNQSVAAVLGYLDAHDPEAAARARQRYACLGPTGADRELAAQTTVFDLPPACEEAVVAQLVELQRLRETGRGDGAEEAFSAVRNAASIIDASQYYRTMFKGRIESWNVRDRHMADTVDALLEHLGPSGKIVVWAHNSHVGDARASELGAQGEWSLGQLVRERHGEAVCLVGLTTHAGTVTAAREWGDSPERRRVRPALPGSYERLFHEIGIPRFALDLQALGEAAGELREVRLQRAIGVVYRPESERQSHYFEVRLPAAFDFIAHFDQTRALEPIDRAPLWDLGEPAETYPFGV